MFIAVIILYRNIKIYYKSLNSMNFDDLYDENSVLASNQGPRRGEISPGAWGRIFVKG